jgi:subtilase family serine protease
VRYEDIAVRPSYRNHAVIVRSRCVAVTVLVVAVGSFSAASAGARTTSEAAQLGPARAGQPLQLVIPLVAREAALERFAVAVATPGSADYGRYESVAELARRFGASRSVRARVMGYLRRAGATAARVDATGLFAYATLSVRRADRVFDVRLARFRSGRASFIAPASAAVESAGAHVPAALRGVALSVVGLDTRPLRGVRPDGSGVSSTGGRLPYTGTPSGCAGALATDSYTPNQYNTANDYDPLRAAGFDGQGERVALIEVQGFEPSDGGAFAQCFGLNLPQIRTFQVDGTPALAPGQETELDLEAVIAAAPDLSEIDTYETNGDLVALIKAFAAPLQNPARVPQVISTSIGLCDPSLVGANSQISAFEATLAEAAAAGVSVLSASGDEGSSECSTEQGPIHELADEFPASSPLVTAVGGTEWELNSANQITQQIVWDDGLASGGGPSELFARPPYQDGVVSGNKRGDPDVSLYADEDPGYAIYCSLTENGCYGTSQPWTSVGGTSFSSPLLAGGFALVDQELHAAGREPLGLANPLLYALGKSSSAASVFNDVTSGTNDLFATAGGAPLSCCTAAPGYDEATGWGSVNLAGLAKAALAVQPPVAHVSLTIPGGQHPISSHQIKAVVTCTAACLPAASAAVSIGAGRPFTVSATAISLTKAGRRTIVLEFSHSQLSELRSGRAAHKRLTAAISGEIIDQDVYGAGGSLADSVESRTAAVRLRIS